MARRQLLTDEERQALFGFPIDLDGPTRCFTLSRSGRKLVAERRNDTSRLGCAVQLALLRHPGTTLANLNQRVEPLVAWMAEQLDIPAGAFARYSQRPQTVTDHARKLAPALGVRLATAVDLPLIVEAAAEAARGTDAWCPHCGRRRSGVASRTHPPAGRRGHRAHCYRRPRPGPSAGGGDALPRLAAQAADIERLAELRTPQDRR